jgi:hypothetical protein
MNLKRLIGSVAIAGVVGRPPSGSARESPTPTRRTRVPELRWFSRPAGTVAAMGTAGDMDMDTAIGADGAWIVGGILGAGEWC